MRRDGPLACGPGRPGAASHCHMTATGRSLRQLQPPGRWVGGGGNASRLPVQLRFSLAGNAQQAASYPPPAAQPAIYGPKSPTKAQDLDASMQRHAGAGGKHMQLWARPCIRWRGCCIYQPCLTARCRARGRLPQVVEDLQQPEDERPPGGVPRKSPAV